MTCASFARYIERARQRGELVVQPRMGFSDPTLMRRGLAATRLADAKTVGTLTLDSFTRVRDYASLRQALVRGEQLNGYPIVTHGPRVTWAVMAGIRSADFPVQVRHGSAVPGDIVDTLVRLGLDATEGGPVSYCLPYSRVPIAESVRAWALACRTLAELREIGVEPHLESFGGCMLGQLCPPSLLIAISVLECMFFQSHGLRSVSLSYAQQTNTDQDLEALAALRALATEFLPDTDRHIVLYTYMGVYPTTRDGSLALLRDSAQLAVRGGADRLIVKTAAEAARIPTIAENVEALELASAAARSVDPPKAAHLPPDTGIRAEARAIITAVLNLDSDLGTALRRGVEEGLLDVPYCLHPDNRGRTRGGLDADGRLYWSRIGALPLAEVTGAPATAREFTSAGLLKALTYVRDRYDNGRHLPGRIPVARRLPADGNILQEADR